MLDADLFPGQASAFHLVEQFRVHHRAARFQRMLLKKIRMQELKRTIDIAYRDAEYQANKLLPAPGVEFAHPGILTGDTITKHGIVGIDVGEEGAQIFYIKLAISIHKKCEPFV